jgi:RND family efflux transporter MFP subunit
MHMNPLLNAARLFSTGLLITASAGCWAQSSPSDRAATYETVAVSNQPAMGHATMVDAAVEAIRQTRLASQVAGSVVAVNVRVGDHVRAGQVLVRLDGQNAQEQAMASQSQLQAAESANLTAARDFDRQKRLFEMQYISQAALERAQTQKDVAQAKLQSARAQSNMAIHQSGFYNITAPYDGVVSELSTVLGDMALPGKPLLTVYDPKAMRLRAFVPQAWQSTMPATAQPKFSLQDDMAPQTARSHEWVPVVDSATHSVELRINLPVGSGLYLPGQFARVWLPMAPPSGTTPGRLWIPATATIKRSELLAVYVVKPDGEIFLRQVRLGQTQGDWVEVLSGLDAAERIVRQARSVNLKKDH